MHTHALNDMAMTGKPITATARDKSRIGSHDIDTPLLHDFVLGYILIAHSTFFAVLAGTVAYVYLELDYQILLVLASA